MIPSRAKVLVPAMVTAALIGCFPRITPEERALHNGTDTDATADTDVVDTDVVDTGSPERPVAVCDVAPPTVTLPGATARFAGHDSFDPLGHAITSFTWRLTERPAASSAVLDNEPTVPDRVFTPDLAGRYTADLVVTTDDNRSSAPCEVSVDALPALDELRIEMFWTHSRDDMDLHLLAPGGTLTLSTDCYYGNCQRSWASLDWGPGGPDGNPTMELDDIPGTGPEITSMASNPGPGAYQIVVHDYPGSVYNGENPTTVNVYLGGVLVWTDTRAMDVPEGTYVYFASIDMPSGVVTARAATRPRAFSHRHRRRLHPHRRPRPRLPRRRRHGPALPRHALRSPRRLPRDRRPRRLRVRRIHAHRRPRPRRPRRSPPRRHSDRGRVRHRSPGRHRHHRRRRDRSDADRRVRARLRHARSADLRGRVRRSARVPRRLAAAFPPRRPRARCRDLRHRGVRAYAAPVDARARRRRRRDRPDHAVAGRCRAARGDHPRRRLPSGEPAPRRRGGDAAARRAGPQARAIVHATDRGCRSRRCRARPRGVSGAEYHAAHVAYTDYRDRVDPDRAENVYTHRVVPARDAAIAFGALAVVSIGAGGVVFGLGM